MSEPEKKPSSDQVGVTSTTGKTGYISPEYADAASRTGTRKATETELRQAQKGANEEATSDALRKKFEGSGMLASLEGEFAPTAAGMARGLSLGTSDEAILSAAEMLGGSEGREAVRARLNDYKAYAPVHSTVGEVGGIALGALAGDEAALGAAPGMVSRLGAGAEAGAARLLGGGAVARGVGILARGGVEGAAFGAGDIISESSLANQDLTAESLIGGASHGALGGMLAAGVLGGAAKGLSGLRGPKPGAEAFRNLAEGAYGEAAPGVGKAIAEDVSSAYRTPGTRGPLDAVAEPYISNLPTATAQQQAQMGEAWANRARVFGKHAETVENASREFSTALNDALESGRKVDMASFGEAKVNQMSKLVDQTKFAEQSNAAIAWATDAQKVVNSLQSDATSGMTSGARKQWDGYMQRIASGIESGNSIELHTALDETKRFVGRQAQFGKGPFGLSTTAREFDDLYQGSSGLKSLLEDNVWGEKAANAQRNINGATFNMLSEGKLFSRKFTTEFGSEAGRPLYTADTAAVSGFMGRLTSSANDLDARGVESWIQARRHYLNAVQKSYSYDAEAAAAITKERANLEKLDGVYRQTTKDVTLANQVKGALDEERQRGIGGALGAVLDVANKPYTSLQRLAQLESQTKGVINKITGGAGDLVGSTVEKVPPKPPKTGGGFFSALFDGVGKTATKTAGEVGGISGRAAFQKRIDDIGTMAGHPEIVVDRVSNSLSPYGKAAPNVVGAATGVALRGISFLASKMPPSRQDEFSLQPQLSTKSRASDAEVSQFMRFNQAVDNPLIVFREAKSGTLTRDHVEAVKAVYPALYDKMRSEVMTSLASSKKQMAYPARIQLGILLDLPTDKTLSPAFLREIQATYSVVDQADAESPPPKITAPQLAGSFQTATQSAVERA
jgi:hypothetical protein